LVNITFNFSGPYKKSLGTIFISFALFSNARLNFDGMSRLWTEFSSLFRCLTDESTNDEELVEESLQKGTVRSMPLSMIT